jgi:hypothetical protein
MRYPARQIRHLTIALIVLLLAPLVATGVYAAPAARPATLTLPNAALARDSDSGRIYLIWNNTRHWINSEAAFGALGYTMQNVQNYPGDQINSLPQGNTLGVNTVANGLIWPLAPILSTPVTVTLSQPSVTPGSQMQISAAGFTPGEQVTVTAPGATFTVNANGSGNVQASVPVAGNAAPGLQDVYLAGVTSNLLGVGVFTVIGPGPAPTLNTPSTTAAPGVSVPLTGAGFAPGEPVELFLNNGAAAVTTSASGAGTFGPVALPLPGSLSTGSASVLAYGTTSHQFATLSITIANPAISLTPSAVSPGSQVAINGTGFAAGEVVLIRFNGAVIGTTNADSLGNFGGFLFTVPSGTAGGSYSVSATGSISAHPANATLTINTVAPPSAPTISLSPSTVVRGSSVSVTGTGFVPGETVTMYFNNALAQSTTANSGGSFTNSSFTVAGSTAPGAYTVQAIGAISARAASAPLQVIAAPAPSAPGLSLNPAQSTHGGLVHVFVSGFGANETVLIWLNGAIVAAVNTGPAGNGSGTLHAPGRDGLYMVTATGAVSGRSVSATLRVVSPVVAQVGVGPARAHRGNVITVHGSHFGAFEVVLIYFNGRLMQAAETGRDGNFSGARITVPGNTPFGVSLITVEGGRSHRTARTAVTILPAPAPAPRLSISPGTAHRDALVTVSGSGFFGREVVVIRFRGDFAQAVVTGPKGKFANVHFRIPVNSPFGVQAVQAQGSRSGRSALTHIRIVPVPTAFLRVTPFVVPRGGQVVLSGGGFLGRERVLLEYRGGVIGLVQAAPNGTFGNLLFHIPAGSPLGFQRFSALGTASRRTASTDVRVVEAAGMGLSASPNPLRRGQSATVSGYGFLGHETLLVYVDGRLVQAGQSDANGNFYRLRFSVPGNLPGPVAVITVDGARSRRHVSLTVRII